MIRPDDNDTDLNMEIIARAHDRGRSGDRRPASDLNTLLAQEQTSIMNAESAQGDADYERHRNASRDTRQLINATPYPEHEAHVFDRERAPGRPSEYDDVLERLIHAVEENEFALKSQFSAGDVSVKAYQSRSRFVRQDRERVARSLSDRHME